MKAFNKKKKPKYQRSMSLIFSNNEYMFVQSQYIVKNGKVKKIRTLKVEELGGENDI